jgi:nitroreductase
MLYHGIEKGLSLRAPRPGFGESQVLKLITLVRKYRKLFGDRQAAAVAVGCLHAYQQFNGRLGKHNTTIDTALREFSSNGGGELSDGKTGGVQAVKRSDIWRDGMINIAPFLSSRHSIRQFSDEEVDTNQIQQAVQLALRTPSVCNRQAWRVHAIADPTLKGAALALQNGNRGFGEQIKVLLIVTSRLDQFASVGERNQPWVDGGLFAMTLVYALHSLGLGTCFLNWSVPLEIDQALRKVIPIEDSESVITYIAIGKLPEEFAVAMSPRRPVGDVLVWHSAQEGPCVKGGCHQ